MLPPIPTELYEAIIDQTDHPTLKNCALVCRALRPRCQKIIFTRITLDAPPDARYLKSERFYDLISRYPHLCPYVEALEVSELDQSMWIAVDIYLGRILSELLHLKELVIVGRISQWGRLNFDMLVDDFRAAILSKCRSPQLTTLRLTNTHHVPLHMLRQAPALKSLSLTYCSLGYGSDVVVGYTIAPILRNLSLVQWRSSGEWIYFVQWIKKGNLDITQLATLRLDIKALDQPLLPQIEKGLIEQKWFIEQCSSTVESLELMCPESAVVRSCYDLLDLGTMLRLRSLVLYGCVWGRETFGNTALQWHIDILKKIPSHHRFETITLIYNIEDNISFEMSGFVNETNWSGFIATMQGLHEKTMALNVTFHVKNARGPLVHDVIQNRLRALERLGIFVIEQTMMTTDLVLFGA